jgi:putative ABC transport system permease protein
MKEFYMLMVFGLIVGLGIGVVAATPLTNMLVDNSSSTTEQSDSGMGGMRRGMMKNATAIGTGQQTLNNIQTSVGMGTILYGVLAAMMIAILGSAVPAYFISTIKPSEAMRNE